MGLPLPKVVADVGPGGPLVTAMGGINALNNAMLLRKINAIKAQYAPLTTQADAASKMAYANLMGPQFLAKIMGNDSAVANLSEDQKKGALQQIYQAGTGQSTGNAILNMPTGNQISNGIGQPSTNALSAWIKSKFQNALSQTPNSAPANNGQQNRDASLAQLAQYYKSPQGQQQMANEGYPNGYPQANQLTMNPQQQTAAPTYAENVGTYKGIVNEGGEAGNIRAKNIDALNQTVFNAENKATTLNDITGILSSPAIDVIRNVPLAGRHELAYYAKEGTPEQQRLIGRYYTDMGDLIKSSARDFAGQFRTGEQQLLNAMKPAASDTTDVARGKVQSLTYFNEMMKQRAQLTSKIMSENHVNQLQAQEVADKQINGDKLRESIHDKLNPTVTIRNNKTGETKTVPIAEARKLGAKNV